ncbi:MAG: peptide chain release factor N(5)-glutamine methyltransferase [Paludibacteraceae bacterium]|nr:peptide chain release factor N(5)-glutamine methyltransferase [Paludibacteraceae bacterium]
MDALREKFCSALSSRYTRSEALALWRVFVSEVCGMTESQTYFCKDNDFTDKQGQILTTIGRQLAQGVPYQHLLGWQELGGLRFRVSPDVLIPRPETAELVEWIRQDLASHPPATLLDLGTGSGYLAVTLSLAFPHAHVTAVDLSDKALAVAQENAQFHHTAVEFIHADMLQPLPLDSRLFDLIVSNPPYVRPGEKKDMDDTVLEHEPAMALFVPENDPLVFYRSIGETAQNLLSPAGTLYVEINRQLGAETCALFQSQGFRTELRRDSFGNDRMIKAVRL